MGETINSNTAAGLELCGSSTTTTIVLTTSPTDVIEDFLCSRQTTLGTHLRVTGDTESEVDVHRWNNQSLTFFFLMHFIELQLIYNVVLVSGIQQNYSVIYIYMCVCVCVCIYIYMYIIYIYIYPFSIMVYYRYWIQFTAMQ